MRIKITLLALLLATLIAGKKTRNRGFMLVYEQGYCDALGKTLGTDIRDPHECFKLARKHKATDFSMGRRYRRGKCSVELLDFDCGTYKQWQVCVPTSRPPHAYACL